ncbi:MAG: DUF4251 domain-containing protein [Rikenellaceae bacterium]
MKTFTRNLAVAFAAVLILSGFSPVMAAHPGDTPTESQQEQKVSKKELKKLQEEASAMRIKKLLETEEFTFVGELMTAAEPGNSQSLNGSYDVKIGKDKIICSLPYIGRSSGGHYGSDGGSPFIFESTDFSVEIKEGKKSVKYTYSIDPIGTTNHMTFYFEIWYKNGRAVLNAVQSKGDPARFDGYIKSLD